MAKAVVVHPVSTPRDERLFLELPYRLYRSDAYWVAPLRMSERRRWSPRYNASLHGRWTRRFLARCGRSVLGRIAVAIDPAFGARWLPGAGFFGFFECEDDRATAAALFNAAESALREQGCTHVLGPVNLTTHDEVGLLVYGFGSRPAVLSPYNPPFYEELVLANAYQPERDYHAFLWRPGNARAATVDRLVRAAGRGASGFAGVRFRHAQPARWQEEVRALHSLYNGSFAAVWGFVPISLEEFAQRAESFRPFFRPELLIIAESDDAMIGFALVLPDINEVLAGMDGHLLPFGWVRLLLGIPRIRSARFILIGVLPAFASRGVAPVLAALAEAAGRRLGIRTGEISLIAGANRRMLRVVRAFGLQPTKTFRLFQKRLVPA